MAAKSDVNHGAGASTCKTLDEYSYKNWFIRPDSSPVRTGSCSSVFPAGSSPTGFATYVDAVCDSLRR